MLQKLIDNKLAIIQIIFLIGLFVLIRTFENRLFYDPFLEFFKRETITTYPKFEPVKLYSGFFVRYFLNTIISLAILYTVFREKDIVLFSLILYFMFFIILIVGFYFCLNYFDESQRMVLFYIRRFIIQPIFILLFIPGFYFQKQSKIKIKNIKI